MSALEIPTNPTDVVRVFGLFDTGASHSMIDEGLVNRLGLIQIDRTMVAGVHGLEKHPQFLVGIHLPHLDTFRFGKFTQCNLRRGNQSHEVLLGRDIMRNTVMIYDGLRGQVTIAATKIEPLPSTPTNTTVSTPALPTP